MNKLKAYTEYIILAALAVLLLMYIIFRSAGNINYKLPEPSLVEPDDISRISIEGPGTELDFSKTDQQWYIEPESWEAENSNLTAIAKTLGELKIADLISTSGNPGVYELEDEQKYLVKAYDRDSLVRELYVGKVSSNGIYTYVMFPGNDSIYSVRGNLPSRVKDKNSMRDKRFLQLNRNSVQKMTLKGDYNITLSKDTEGVWSSDSIEADDAGVKSVVNMFDPLRCKDFLYDQPAGAAEWTIELLTDEGVVSLDIWPETDNEIYPVRNSQNGYFVQATPYAVEKILGAFGIEFETE